MMQANVAKGKYARPSQLSRDVHLMLQNFESWYPVRRHVCRRCVA